MTDPRNESCSPGRDRTEPNMTDPRETYGMNLIDLITTVQLWNRADHGMYAETPREGSTPLAVADGRSVTVPDGFSGPATLIALAADGTPLMRWAVDVGAGEIVSVA